MATAVLGFSLQLATCAQDLRDAAAVRAQAYGHHVPTLREALAQPDATDSAPGTVVLVCRDKASGQAIGTARIQRNHPQPLQIEASTALPAPIAACARAEITRLAIVSGADPQVRALLVKACYLFAVASQIRWLVIGARSGALIRLYKGLGFEPLLADDAWAPLAHAGGLPHQVLAFDVVSAERTWHARGHGLYPFMVETWHPDLQLLAAPSWPVERPPVVARRRALAPAAVPGGAAVAVAARRRAAPAPAVQA